MRRVSPARCEQKSDYPMTSISRPPSEQLGLFSPGSADSGLAVVSDLNGCEEVGSACSPFSTSSCVVMTGAGPDDGCSISPGPVW